MMAALVAGERDPVVLAGMARTAMRKKIPDLREAFEGRFSTHHAFLLSRMLTHVDADYYDQHRGTQRAIRSHIRSLQALGYQVTLHPAA